MESHNRGRAVEESLLWWIDGGWNTFLQEERSSLHLNDTGMPLITTCPCTACFISVGAFVAEALQVQWLPPIYYMAHPSHLYDI